MKGQRSSNFSRSQSYSATPLKPEKISETRAVLNSVLGLQGQLWGKELTKKGEIERKAPTPLLFSPFHGR